MEPGEGQALATKLGLQALGFDRARPALRRAGLDPHRRRRAAAAGGPWPTGYAVTVEYEAPKIAGRKVYPPYMAVWVTDQNNRLVRALSLLGKDPNYIDQNFIWWRRHGRGVPDIVDSVSRPTRAPAATPCAGTARTTPASLWRSASTPSMSRRSASMAATATSRCRST